VSLRFRLVTGTGTEVGKTITTAALACAESAAGRKVRVVKPVQTGLAPDERGDADEVRRLAGVEAVELVRLPEPLAPESAARRSGAVLPTVADLARRTAATTRAWADGLVLVEGAGGVAVRLDSAGGTLLDLGVALQPYGQVDVVLVVSAGLGTLNHTELSATAIRQAGLATAGLVIGSWPARPDLAALVNRHDLPRLTGLPVLAVIPEGAGRLSPEQFRTDAPWAPLRAVTSRVV